MDSILSNPPPNHDNKIAWIYIFFERIPASNFFWHNSNSPAKNQRPTKKPLVEKIRSVNSWNPAFITARFNTASYALKNHERMQNFWRQLSIIKRISQTKDISISNW